MSVSSGSKVFGRAVMKAWLVVTVLTSAGIAAAQPGRPSAVQHTQDRPAIDVLIADAARRLGVPKRWIRAVMRQESAFDPDATSSAGAMGLMQVMPDTYAELRGRHGLGSDPYDPRDNVMAGAAYLRELHDRFGPEGMLAAYNAGPSRYLQHRNEGRPLPAETRDYVARIGTLTGLPVPSAQDRRETLDPPDPARSPLFPALSGDAQPTASSLFASLTKSDRAEGQSPR